MRRLPVFALVLGLLLAVACAQITDRANKTQVLFVGNSLTYVGNLPAVFDALSHAGSHGSRSDMIVAARGTLTDRVDDGSVERALANGDYTHVVLQERGGDFMCSFGPASCQNARSALGILVSTARKHGASPLLLGSYQPRPQASVRIVDAESSAADAIGLPYVPVSRLLSTALETRPDLAWLHEDGGHPGASLTLLQALLIHEHIHREPAAKTGFTIRAPIYSPSSGLVAELRTADARAPKADTPLHREYTASEVTLLLQLIAAQAH